MMGSMCKPLASTALAYVAILSAAGMIQTAAAGRLSDADIDLMPVVVQGLESPLFVTHAGDGSGRLFVLEQPGRVRLVEKGKLLPQPFLDISSRVKSGGEQGLLGLAFHPGYRHNGRLFLNYNRKPDGATVLAEYKRGNQPFEALSEERILMIVPQPYSNHNGGMIVFGPDGYLYIGRGDGGSRGDPQNRAQNPEELLGKILRIDVDHDEPYAIPGDNPFVREGGRPEIFALGIRNPWRFSFDRKTRVLWLGDVGQNRWEEIDIVTRGSNYGWRLMEGFHCYEPPQDCQVRGLTFPILEYEQEKGRCSVIGGYVYRGALIPALRGTYVFGDYCSGELFGIQTEQESRASRKPDVLKRAGFKISSLGEDEAGEVYVVDYAGGLYQLVPSPSAPAK